MLVGLNSEQVRYRDTKTGRFVSAATWKRSRSHGGTRYRRLSGKRTGPRRAKGKKSPATAPAALPGYQRETGPIPIEFMEAADEFFESGYESDEEDEYP